MPTTTTPITGLKKGDKGDANWHLILNDNANLLDILVGGRGADPNVTAVPVVFVGQRFYQINAHAYWVGTTVGTPPTGAWTREIPRGTVMAFNATMAPFGWTPCTGATIVIDGVSLTTQNLMGRKIVGFNPADAEYDTIGEIHGSRSHTVVNANIAKISPIAFRQDNGTTACPSGNLTTNFPAAPGMQMHVGVDTPTPIDHRDPEITLLWCAKL